jgi:thiamine pyrophosphokinase
MRTIIFANGHLKKTEHILAIIQADDLLIAADGGARHFRNLGLVPHFAVGDFDSLTTAETLELEQSGVQIIRYSERKDYTDLELALQLAVERGADEVIIFAALGNRWDQTLANLLLPAASHLSQLQVRLIDNEQEITLLRGGESLALTGLPGDTISLISVRGDAEGVTTHGLEYPLNQEKLFFGSTRGVSNVMRNSHAQVSLDKGLLICVTIHNNPAEV